MDVQTIKDLFCANNRRFSVPAYQRAYSWGKKQINQLIEDLENASSHYYLGHFLFEVDQTDKNNLLIIDGQQRLTTCIIFFACLHNELNRRNEGSLKDLIDDIENYYIRDICKKTQKLVTVSYDNSFFIDEIIDFKTSLSGPESRSQELILNAKNIFQTKFSNTKTTQLLKWKELIETASITTFEVSDKIQAAQIFAFQNDRGKKLSKIEVLKSYFMLQIYLCSENTSIAQENIKYLEENFKFIYQNIVNINLGEDDVLTYYWRTLPKSNGYNSDEVVGSVKNCLMEIIQPYERIEWIKNFVSGLSRAFIDVRKIETSDNSYIRDLYYLNNMALAYPFLLKALRLDITSTNYQRLIKLLENITFRTLLRGGRAAITDRLNWFLINSNSNDEFEKHITAIVTRINTDGYWWYWSDQQMRENLNTSYFYKNRVDNYLLWKYELYLCNSNHPMPHAVSFNDLINNESIEHIAPQTPTDNKPVANGYGEYKVIEEPSLGIESGGWLNCVGNLMLISQSHNSSIGNKPFPDKLKSYADDNLLNQQKEISSFVDNIDSPIWNIETIKKRHQKILDAAQNIWSLKHI